MSLKSRTRSQQRRIVQEKMNIANIPSLSNNTDTDNNIITHKNMILSIAEENKLEQLKTICNKLFDLIDIKMNNDNSDTEIQNLEGKIIELNTVRASMEEKLRSNESRINNIIDESNSQINDFKYQISQKEKETQDLYNSTTNTIKKQDNTIKLLQADLQKSLDQITQYETGQESLLNQIKKLEEENNGLQLTTKSLKKIIDEQKLNNPVIDSNNKSQDSDKTSNTSLFTISCLDTSEATSNTNNTFNQPSLAEELQATIATKKTTQESKTTTEKNRTNKDKQHYKNVPLEPEIQILYPGYGISPEKGQCTSKDPNYEKDVQYATQIKLAELEDEIKRNNNRITVIENRIKSSNTNEKLPPLIETKNKCIIIGDSHTKFLKNSFSQHNNFLQKTDIQITTKPGIKFADTCKLLPKNLDRDSTLIICAGTNDIYKTESQDIGREIDKLGKTNQQIILISIPPQRSPHTNRNIININTKIKYQCKQYKNIKILNTHAFIKPQHVSWDGIHLSKRAINWIATKLVSMMCDTTQHNNNISATNRNNPKTPNTTRPLKLYKNLKRYPHTQENQEKQYKNMPIGAEQTYQKPPRWQYNKQNEQYNHRGNRPYQQQYHHTTQNTKPSTQVQLKKQNTKILNDTIDITQEKSKSKPERNYGNIISMEGNHTQERPFHTGPEKDELWYGNPNTRNYLHPILTNTYNTIPNIYHTIPNSYHQSPNFLFNQAIQHHFPPIRPSY